MSTAIWRYFNDLKKVRSHIDKIAARKLVPPDYASCITNTKPCEKNWWTKIPGHAERSGSKITISLNGTIQPWSEWSYCSPGINDPSSENGTRFRFRKCEPTLRCDTELMTELEDCNIS